MFVQKILTRDELIHILLTWCLHRREDCQFDLLGTAKQDLNSLTQALAMMNVTSSLVFCVSCRRCPLVPDSLRSSRVFFYHRNDNY